MELSFVLLCVTATIAARCEGAMIWHEGRPVEETDLELTASDSDSGNWTANLGDMEVKIEHRHEDGSALQNGIWTLDVARTFFETEKDDRYSGNVDPPEEEITSQTNTSQEELEQNTAEDTVISEARGKEAEIENEIPVDVRLAKKDATKFSLPRVRELPIPGEQHTMSTRVPENLHNSEEQYESDEVILDSDNFEYFKDVGWFKLDDRHLDWSEARDACAEVGAHLAAPDTLDRVNVLLKLFQRHPDIPAKAILRQQVYVGISEPSQNRHFTTEQGLPFASELPIWFHNEPDNAPPGEYCVTFHIEGRAQDVPCFYRLPFFCEK
ncbi:hypothetical protein B7P43_G02546 [Cryptotermes secundus]|uniref:C-type lectin domain-containing protein n=2 Tax=Cryptotermes secundus TaxID=105785 RepID=A0A2J7RNH5_9NEOP|nr:hypothetical protein B7P43_G02546 [Cryptotermes secundus]